MTKTLSFAALLLSATVMAGAAQAQTADAYFMPKQAGDILVRARVIDVDPQTSTSSVSVIGGKVSVTDTIAPEVDLSYFFTSNIAVEAIAASTRHVASVSGSALNGGKKVDVGSVWVLPPTVTVQYHFLSQQKFSPYLGAGVTVAWFYNSTPQSGLNRISFTNSVGPAIQAGFDYAVTGPWSLNADIKQLFLNTKASVNSGFVKAKTALNPTVFGLGVGYRF